jgi:Putative Actinobacterial Holin-X, holin superfamily III
VQPSGLRLWVGSLIHWPARQLHGRLEATEHRIEERLESIQVDLEHRARQFERAVAAWAIAALLLMVAGIFFLIGVWLALAQLLGPVWASFLLAIAFGGLAAAPLLALRKTPGARKA